jgi:hypothetical protein
MKDCKFKHPLENVYYLFFSSKKSLHQNAQKLTQLNAQNKLIHVIISKHP